MKRIISALLLTAFFGVTALAVNSTDKTMKPNLDLEGNSSIKKAKEVEVKKVATGTSANAGYLNIFAKSNGLPYFKDENGMETPLVAGMGAQWIGNIDYGYASNCDWNSTSSSFTDFSADTDCNTPTVTGSVTAPGTKIPAVIVPVDDTEAHYIFVVSGYTRTGGGTDACAIRATDGTDHSKQVFADAGATPDYQREFRIKFSSKGSKTVKLQMKSESGADSCRLVANLAAREFSIDVYKMGGTGSAGAVINEWQSYTPTFQGFGTPTGVNALYRRVGDSMELQVSFTSGTTTATEARVYLPGPYTIDSSKFTAVQNIGDFWSGEGVGVSWDGKVRGAAGDSYVTFGRNDQSGFGARNGANIVSPGYEFSFRATVPISGWTGGFTGGGTTVYSARINNSGSCSVESGSERPNDWISAASRPGAGQCSLTVNFAKAPHCWTQGINASTPVFGNWGAGVPTTTNVTTVMYDSAGNTADTDHFVFCRVD